MKTTPMQAKDAIENIRVASPKEYDEKVNEVFAIANKAIQEVEQLSVRGFDDQVVMAQETERTAAKAFNAVGDTYQELRRGELTLDPANSKRVNAVREAALENVKALRREADMLDHFAGELADPEAYAEKLFDTYSILRPEFPHI